MADFGRSPDGSGYSAEPEPCFTVSAVPVSIPNAEELLRQLDEADRRAGAAERQMAALKEEAFRRKCWLSDAKEAAGYTDNTSFDVVWAEALSALAYMRAQPPEFDGMAVMDHGMRSTPKYALEIVRKHEPGMMGLIHNLERLQGWLNAYVARAKASGMEAATAGETGNTDSIREDDSPTAESGDAQTIPPGGKDNGCPND